MAELPYSAEELDHLAGLIATAELSGIVRDPATLAQFLLVAGYRKVPDPPPQMYGVCRSCTQVHPLTDEGMVVEHDDPRPGHGQCLLSRVTPERVVEAPEAVSADGR